MAGGGTWPAGSSAHHTDFYEAEGAAVGQTGYFKLLGEGVTCISEE